VAQLGYPDHTGKFPVRFLLKGSACLEILLRNRVKEEVHQIWSELSSFEELGSAIFSSFEAEKLEPD
jgi:hypothetical protein